MKMWKVAAFASMLLASSVFGAVTISAPAQVMPAGDGSWTLDVTINFTGGENAAGIGLFAVPSVVPGVTATRTNMNPAITDLTTPSVVDKALTATTPDLGGAVTDVLGGPFLSSTGRLMTLQLKAPGIATPIQIHFQGTWVDAATLDTGVGALDAVTLLMPEPVSGLLLAAGALFFARRRR